MAMLGSTCTEGLDLVKKEIEETKCKVLEYEFSSIVKYTPLCLVKSACPDW